MTAGRKRHTPRATHVVAQDGPKVPGRDVDGLNTKVGKQREKAAKRAAEKAARRWWILPREKFERTSEHWTDEVR